MYFGVSNRFLLTNRRKAGMIIGKNSGYTCWGDDRYFPLISTASFSFKIYPTNKLSHDMREGRHFIYFGLISGAHSMLPRNTVQTEMLLGTFDCSSCRNEGFPKWA